ncbi:MAG: hypothetical protein RBS39_00815 [Phycisphaerales bacterium]|jgi:hypothetical protein|nr:hypothetical protein [Phycisphaerales bacterium]
MVGEPLGTIALVSAVTLLGLIAGAMGVRAILLPPGRLIPKRRSPKPGPDAKAAAPHRVMPLARAAYASLGFVLIAGAAPLMAYVVEAPAMLAHVAPRRSLAYAAYAFMLVLLTLTIATGCMWWFVTRSRRGDTPPAPRSRARRVSRVFLAFLLAVGLGALGWGAVEGAHARWDRVQREWQYWDTEPWMFLAWEAIALWLALSACAFFVVAWRAYPSRGRPRCPKCWYDMSGATGLLCPECGRTAKSPRALHRTRRSGALFVLGVLLAGVAYGAWATPRISRGGVVAIVPTWALIQWWEHIPDNRFEGGTGKIVDLSLRDRPYRDFGSLARGTLRWARARAMNDARLTQDTDRFGRAFWIILHKQAAFFDEVPEPSFTRDELDAFLSARAQQMFTQTPIGGKLREVLGMLEIAEVGRFEQAVVSQKATLVPLALDWLHSGTTERYLAARICAFARPEGDEVYQMAVQWASSSPGKTAFDGIYALSWNLTTYRPCFDAWLTLARSSNPREQLMALNAARTASTSLFAALGHSPDHDDAILEDLRSELRRIATSTNAQSAGLATRLITKYEPRTQSTFDGLLAHARAAGWASGEYAAAILEFSYLYEEDGRAQTEWSYPILLALIEGVRASDVTASEVGNWDDYALPFDSLKPEETERVLAELHAILEPDSGASEQARKTAQWMLSSQASSCETNEAELPDPD